MVTDAQRRGLYDELVRSLGRAGADTMMELLPPVGWSDVARRGDIENLRVELRGEIAQLRGEMKAELAKLARNNYLSMIGLAGLVLAAAKVT